MVDKDGIIIVGHTRLKAAKKLGLKQVPIVVAENLTDEKVKAYRLADNKTGELAGWDFNLLDDELADINNIDMEDFGFDPAEESDDKAVDDEFDEEPPEEPTSKLGDVYQLGRHRLMCGDSTDTQSVKTLMGGQLADLLITDPPYNVDYSSKDYGRDKVSKTRTNNQIENDKMSDDDFINFITNAFKSAYENVKKGASFYCWYSGGAAVQFNLGIKNAGFSVKENLIWVKNNIVLGRQDYQ